MKFLKGSSFTASAAKKLETPVKINGVDFDGTKDITISAGSDGGGGGTSAPAEKRVLEVSLQPANWSNKMYRIEDSRLKATDDIIMSPANGTHDTIYELIADARIVCEEQGDGYIVIKALGSVPDQIVGLRFLIL